MIMHLNALDVRMEFLQRRLDAGTVLRVAVGQICGKRVMGRENDGINRKSWIIDNVLDRSADVVDMIMRDEPVEVQNVHTRRLAELEECIKREGGTRHTAVVKNIVAIEGEDKAVRLYNAGVREAVDSEDVIAEGEIMWKIAVHFILFLSGSDNSSEK